MTEANSAINTSHKTWSARFRFVPYDWPLAVQVAAVMLTISIAAGFAACELVRSYERSVQESILDRELEYTLPLLASNITAKQTILPAQMLAYQLETQGLQNQNIAHLTVTNASGIAMAAWSRKDVTTRARFQDSKPIFSNSGTQIATLTLAMRADLIEKETDRSAATTFLSVFGVMLLLTFCIWVWIQRRVISPISALARRAKKGGLATLPKWMQSRRLSPELQHLSREIHSAFDLKDRHTAEIATARKAADEHTRSKSKFIASISHEIRTPLNGVLGALNLLKGTELNNGQNALVNVAHSSSELLHTLLNDIIDLAKSDNGKLDLEVKPFSLHDTLNSTKDFWVYQFYALNRFLTLNIDDNVPDRIFGDEGRVKQILNNYISNAKKYGGDGSVTIKVSCVPSLGTQEFSIHFAVEDRGKGVKKEDQQMIFTEFAQLAGHSDDAQEGAGLGLAICRKLSTAMNGKVGINNNNNNGSIFWFEAPFTADTEAPKVIDSKSKNIPPIMTSSGTKPIVLVAEDLATNRLVVGQYLEKFGCEVEMAENGIEAIHAAASKNFDVILMDICMPKMDGMDATKRIREGFGVSDDVPVIALSANAMPAQLAEQEKIGFDFIIAKPFKEEALYQALKECMANNSADRLLDQKRLQENLAVQPENSPPIQLEKSIEQLVDTSKKLMDSVYMKDFAAVEITSQKIDQNSANLGLTALEKKCAKIRQSCRSMQLDKVEALMPSFKALVSLSVEQLDAVTANGKTLASPSQQRSRL